MGEVLCLLHHVERRLSLSERLFHTAQSEIATQQLAHIPDLLIEFKTLHQVTCCCLQVVPLAQQFAHCHMDLAHTWEPSKPLACKLQCLLTGVGGLVELAL